MKRNYFWQPEPATAIIYWSSSLIVLFYSLILALENTRPYWKSNLVLGIFLFLVWLGLRRRLYLTEKTIKITYARFWKRVVIPLEKIQAIGIENHHLRIVTNERSYTFVMRKKDLEVLQTHFVNLVPILERQESEK